MFICKKLIHKITTMKNSLLISLYSSLLLITSHIFADPVDSLRALSIAQRFYATKAPILKNGRQQSFNFALSQKLEYVSNQNPVRQGRKSASKEYLYYVFNVENDGGFVIVAGDDASYPIIGYGTQGHFETENQPSNLKGWMQWYAQQLIEIKDKSLKADKEIETTWSNILSGKSLLKSAKVTAVAPLIQTKWNQSPNYNNLCPYDILGFGRSVTGCVATAMAQIMNYHKFPAKGRGRGTYTANGIPQSYFLDANIYDWNNMPNELSDQSNNLQKNVVARLMADCGASVNMNYSAKSSGAMDIDIENGYESKFSYPNFFRLTLL
jgi:Peptidase C10 family/Spi protease inhibitor